MNNLHPTGNDTFDWDQLGKHKLFFEWGIDSPELHDDLRRYWKQEQVLALVNVKLRDWYQF